VLRLRCGAGEEGLGGAQMRLEEIGGEVVEGL
jgi:hypothetical protein